MQKSLMVTQQAERLFGNRNTHMAKIFHDDGFGSHANLILNDELENVNLGQ